MSRILHECDIRKLSEEHILPPAQIWPDFFFFQVEVFHAILKIVEGCLDKSASALIFSLEGGSQPCAQTPNHQ